MSQRKPVKNTRFGRGRYNTDYAPDETGEFHSRKMSASGGHFSFIL